MNLSGLTPYDNSQFTILDLKVCFDFFRYDLYDREENRNRCLIIGSFMQILKFEREHESEETDNKEGE